MTRPTAESIKSYRKYVNKHMENLIDAVEEGSIEIKDFELIMEVGLQHEQQHQELILTDLKHAFSINPLEPALAPDGLDAGGVLVAGDGRQARDRHRRDLGDALGAVGGVGVAVHVVLRCRVRPRGRWGVRCGGVPRVARRKA